MVGFFTSVQSQMRLQISLLVEGLLAVFEGANEVARPVVLLQVHLEALLTTVRFIAARDRADEVFLLLVCFGVISQMAF